MEEVVNLNGTEYTEEDFNEEQSYLVKQLRSCKVKNANLMFELDQIKAAEQAFTNAFLISMKTAEDAESSEDIAEEGK
tara:strand:- start:412 stop:645 length:234 start_codon:yes stop_codon:yes gene_type:complete